MRIHKLTPAVENRLLAARVAHDAEARSVAARIVADVRKREQLLSASITVATANEINQLSLSYQAAGVSFHQALRKEPWGARTFVVSDPDENLILFAGPAAD